MKGLISFIYFPPPFPLRAPSAPILLPLVSRATIWRITSPLACRPLSAPLITPAGPARPVFTTHRISVGDNPQAGPSPAGLLGLGCLCTACKASPALPRMSGLKCLTCTPSLLPASPLPHVPPRWSSMYVAAPKGEMREKVNIPGGSLTHPQISSLRIVGGASRGHLSIKQGDTAPPGGHPHRTPHCMDRCRIVRATLSQASSSRVFFPFF